jgi:hypothetical protein
MNKRVYSITVALLVGVIIGLLMSAGKPVVGQGQGNPPSLAQHLQQFTFSLAPGESRTLTLPKYDVPVKVDICTSQVGGFDSGGNPIVSKSACVSGLFIQNSNPQDLQRMSGNVYAYSDVFRNGSLYLNLSELGTLSVSTSFQENTVVTTGPIVFYVNMWY